MTTSRINQVAFLVTPRPARSPTSMRRGAETREEVVLIGHERLEMGGRRDGGPRAGIAFCI